MSECVRALSDLCLRHLCLCVRASALHVGLCVDCVCVVF